MTETASNIRLPKHETEHNDELYTVNVQLPGVLKEDIKVTEEDNRQLTIKAERAKLAPDSWQLVSEHQPITGYELTVEPPAGFNLNEAAYSFEKNILQVSIPSAKPVTRQIEIE